MQCRIGVQWNVCIAIIFLAIIFLIELRIALQSHAICENKMTDEDCCACETARPSVYCSSALLPLSKLIAALPTSSPAMRDSFRF